LHPFFNNIVVAYELWLKVGGLYDRAFFAEEALPYGKHVFVLLGLIFGVFAVRVSLSHGMTRAVITWTLALFLACLGGVLAATPPVLPNLVLWPGASIATFFALQLVFDLASRPERS
jgi:hypothetical protein